MEVEAEAETDTGTVTERGGNSQLSLSLSPASLEWEACWLAPLPLDGVVPGRRVTW